MQRIPASRRGEYAKNKMWFMMKAAGVHAPHSPCPKLFVLASDDAGELADDGDGDGRVLVDQFEKRFFLDAQQ